MYHWCADETAALMSVLGVIPIAFRWVKSKIAAGWKRVWH